MIRRIRHSLVLMAPGLGLLFITLLIAFSLTQPNLKATMAPVGTSSTDAAVTVTSSCSMTGNVVTAHEAEVTNGTYQQGIGETKLIAFCNDGNGIAIYAIGNSGNSFTAPGNTQLISDVSPSYNISTGTATSGETSNWAMKLTAVDGPYKPTIVGSSDDNITGNTTNYSNYAAVPSDYTKVAFTTAATGSIGSESNASVVKTTYAAFISSLQSPGTYTGKVRYALVHPYTETACKSYTINYYPGNGGTGDSYSQNVCADTLVNPLESSFTPSVTDTQAYAWNTAADGSGTWYYTDTQYNNLALAGESINLYAQYGPKYMQDLSASTCSTVATNHSYTAYDRRDENDYTVRYINNNCWMTQNLRLAKGTTITNTDSNITTSQYTIPTADLTLGNSYSEGRVHDSGNISNGYWYNFCAVTAGSICIQTRLDVTSDICPINWHIPTSTEINSVTGYKNVFQPISGGRYNDGILTDINYGYWWSATPNFGNEQHYIYFDSDYNNMSNKHGAFKEHGFYTRCVRSS